MDEYELPEMLRSPLEELCLEIASLRLGPPADFLAESVQPPNPEVVEHAVELLHTLGAVTDLTGHELTALGQQLARLQVHPVLGKLILMASLFRCFDCMMTICASLGYKSPFLCPMGKEKEANAAKLALAEDSQSDLMALCNAYRGFLTGRNRFANQHFLSPQTMDYICRLREDLTNSVSDVLHRRGSTEDHRNSDYLNDACRAVLLAGLYPKLAWLARRGEGYTLEGLKVKAHPGSVNRSAFDTAVVFFEVQETTDRYLYDTTVVGMAPVLLFAPSVDVLHRGRRVILGIGNWQFAIDPLVADDLLALRDYVTEFISKAVGQEPTKAHLAATDALGRLFSEAAAVEAYHEDDDGPSVGGEPGPEQAGDALPIDVTVSGEAEVKIVSVGERAEGYWPDTDEWLPVVVQGYSSNDTLQIVWDADGSASTVPSDYVRCSGSPRPYGKRARTQ